MGITPDGCLSQMQYSRADESLPAQQGDSICPWGVVTGNITRIVGRSVDNNVELEAVGI